MTTMTLLGKLFRPWDLPAGSDDNSKSTVDSDYPPAQKKSRPILTSCGESESNSSPDVLSKLEKCFNFDNNTSDQGKLCDNESERTVERSEADPDLMNTLYGNAFLNANAINDLANLSRGELTAMGLLPPEPQTLKVKRQRPKRFHCPHCQVAFSNNGQLRGHIRIHTGERPFSCEHEGCGKSFTRNEELTRHRRIHSGLRPFPCTYCGKKFGRKDHLKKHTRTHQRPMYSSGGLIGFGGNPFHPFNPTLMSHGHEFSPIQPSYALPFVLPTIPPPHPHFPFS